MNRHILVPPIKISDDDISAELEDDVAEPDEPKAQPERAPKVEKTFMGEVPNQDNNSSDGRSGERRQGGNPDYGGPERRRHERRSMERLRNEFEYTRAPEPKPEVLDKIGFASKLLKSIKPSRIVLLAIAIFAGGAAAFLTTVDQEAPAVRQANITAPLAKPLATEPEAPVEVIPEKKVLVASQDIKVGQRLTEDLLTWQAWPSDAIRDDFVSSEMEPEAELTFSDAITRQAFFAGEPIREIKLVRGGNGTMSAMIANGKRGVSVSIDGEAASGGFIVPNDHVDVVLTRQTPSGQRSETILRNVKVLAINANVGPTDSDDVPTIDEMRAEMVSGPVIATLELLPPEAEIIVNATNTGRFALVLRSLSDFSADESKQRSGVNQLIRLTSPFWNPPESQTALQ